MALSFEKLAESIKEQAQLIEAQLGASNVLSDEDWKALRFEAVSATPAIFAGRAVLNELSGTLAVDHAYRFVLARAPDAQGLSYGEGLLASGMPPLLFAGLLVVSKEGRQRTSMPSELKFFAALALVHKVISRVQKLTQIPLSWLTFGVARAFSLIYRRWDANTLSRWQLESVKSTLAAWQPVLERQAGQLGAAQNVTAFLQQEVTTLRHELSVARARLNSFSQTASVAAPASNSTPESIESEVPSPVKKNNATNQAGPLNELASELDTYYLAFEDAHRASACDMRVGFQAYQPLLNSLRVSSQADGQPNESSNDRALTQPLLALDIGCGRGEWLVYLQERGFEAHGIDISPAMVSHCKVQGLRVSQCDVLQALNRQPSASLHLLTAFHVAEHLRFDMLYRLVAEAWRVLKPNGILLLETPNPENPLVGSHTFYHDPTHRNPLTPTAMQFLLRYHGFEGVDILRLNPYPESAQVPGDDLLTQRINGLLCGPQDFAIVGRRSEVATAPLESRARGAGNRPLR